MEERFVDVCRQTQWQNIAKSHMSSSLVGGFNPLETYESKWESSPSRGENKQYLKPPPSSIGVEPLKMKLMKGAPPGCKHNAETVLND